MRIGMVTCAALIVCASMTTGFTRSVTYGVTSTQPDRPALVEYQHIGEHMYDGLNYGNRDGDTMPWSISVEDVGTPYILVSDKGKGQPLPELTCSITVGDMVTTHTGVGSVIC